MNALLEWQVESGPSFSDPSFSGSDAGCELDN